MYSKLFKCSNLYIKAIWAGRKHKLWKERQQVKLDYWNKWLEEFDGKSVYWGSKACGLLIFCREDGTLLLLKRSVKVENPGTWGIPGGAIGEGFRGTLHKEKDPDKIVFIESAFKECKEELNTVPMEGKYFGETDFRDGNFTYKTFVYDVPLREKERISKAIKLNWENDDWKWFKYEELPPNLHSGVLFSLKQLVKSGENNAN